MTTRQRVLFDKHAEPPPEPPKLYDPDEIAAMRHDPRQDPTGPANHNRFAKRVVKSDVATYRAQQWFEAQGIPTVVNPRTIAPDWQSRKEHLDKGDLTIQWEGRSHIVEVKWLYGYDWNTEENWPHAAGYMVNRVGNHVAMMEAGREPLLYVSLNKELTHAGIVHVPLTKDKYWFEREARVCGAERPYLYIPTKRVEWYLVHDEPGWTRWQHETWSWEPSVGPLDKSTVARTAARG
jgi:hypothetical protein